MARIPDFVLRAAGVMGRGLVNAWMSTLDYQVAYYDPAVDPAYSGDGKVRLFVFWHEYMQVFLHLRPNCSLAMLLSRHRDADVLEKVAHLSGFDTVRGSTRRGGAEALLGMMKKEARHLHLTITPDGPRGPRRVAAAGSVYLASKLGIPIVPVGVGYDRPWRVPTWDRFAVPRPGTRARLIAGPEIDVPPSLPKDEISRYSLRLERLLNRLSDDAEDWAVRGYRISDSCSIQPGPKNSFLYFAKAKAAETELYDADRSSK